MLSIRVLQKRPPSWHSCLTPKAGFFRLRRREMQKRNYLCKEKPQLQQINSNCPVVFSCGKTRQVSLKSLLDRSTQTFKPQFLNVQILKDHCSPTWQLRFLETKSRSIGIPNQAAPHKETTRENLALRLRPNFRKILWWLKDPVHNIWIDFFSDKYQSTQSQKTAPFWCLLFWLHSQGQASHEPTAQTSLSSPIKSNARHVTSWWFDCRAFRCIEQKLDTRLKFRGFSASFSADCSPGTDHPDFPMLLHNPSWFPCHWPRAWKMMSMSNTFQNTSS